MRTVLSLGLVVFLITGAGCETLKGTANGMAKDVSNTGENLKQGGENIVKFDQWLQEHAW